MTGIVFGEGATILGRGGEYLFEAVAERVRVEVDPVSTPVDKPDAEFVYKVGATTVAKMLVRPVARLLSGDSFSFRSLTPSTCTVDAGGLATPTPGDGAKSCTVEVGNGLDRIAVTQTVYNSTSAPAQLYFKTYKTGSLGKHITDTILAMIAGKTPGDATRLMYAANNYSLTAPAVTRSPNLFAGGFDLSAISVINETSPGSGVGGFIHPAVLISPRHVIGATHYQFGNKLVFMTPDGEYRTANVVSRQHKVGGALFPYNWLDSDVTVGYLDTAITDITPMKVLPATWKDYLPTANRTYVPAQTPLEDQVTARLPAFSKLARNGGGMMRDTLHLNQILYLGGPETPMVGSAYYANPSNEVLGFEGWCTTPIGGDSGGPVFLPINDEAVLLGCYWTAGGFANLADLTTYIDAAMNLLATQNSDPAAGTYAALTVDLNGFTSYA